MDRDAASRVDCVVAGRGEACVGDAVQNGEGHAEPDMEKVMALASEHGIEMLGPVSEDAGRA
ncbi:hypothetical protein FMUAM8_56090 [Nocardia cyriacigeorgica]|nr:hypothetical protein FMUAM8_56090 [Nocardia cyriacigeorgica]